MAEVTSGDDRGLGALPSRRELRARERATSETSAVERRDGQPIPEQAASARPAGRGTLLEHSVGPHGSEPDTLTASAGRGPRRRRLGWFSKLLIGLVVLALAAVGVYAAVLVASLNRIEKVDTSEVLPDYEGRPAAVGDAVNVLLLGSDSREPGTSVLDGVGNRSDTIMLANISADRKHVTVMSIMRDSWVDIPGYGMNKINAAYSFGGVALLGRTLEQLIGARIDHVALVDFDGFKGIVDALGGVTVSNETAFTTPAEPGYPAYDFHQGPLRLADGTMALRYVRERYSFDDGDYQRVRNQQAFLRGVANGVLSRDTLANPVRVQQLVASLGGYVVTDSGLDPGTMAGLATSLAGLRGQDIRMFTLPTAGTGMEGDQSVVYVDEAELPKVRNAWATDAVADYEPPAAA